jgi:nucleotide-binding universal stress UspA family protein
MSIAKIIVPLTGATRDGIALETAFVAALPSKAHVVALYVQVDPRLGLPYMGAPVSADVIQAIIDSSAEMNRTAAKSARTTLAEAATRAGVRLVAAPERAPERAKDVTCSFREMEGYFPQCVADASRLSDLIVFGPVTPADGPELSDAFVEALTKTERPVLLATKPPKSLTGHVTLAWDGSAVAARALLAAMPFLEQAGKITLLSCSQPNAKKPDFRDAEEYCALRGLACTEAVIAPGKRGIGETLLDEAAERRSDLLVMGGFGHSHLSEVFFGGVTQHVRWNATLPVLMVH